ncbi:phosphopantetheine-binding protein [Clostridium estertheticum]|uniref:phosphopantetheine-binding protein n=1 Tax=Clostridium estertheticum TaxID=238834 RepID=UPI0013EEE88A|nr:phosphopantetheine-binding protein [Clostridium estertheticum]MBZ9609913.1 phosphopantetheine-binding protein [Clostridium estertheticum]
MSKDKIFEIVKKYIIEIMGEEDEIDINKSLRYYGTNSIDRADIIMSIIEEIGCKIPLIEFGNLKNIQGIVDVFYSKTNV